MKSKIINSYLIDTSFVNRGTMTFSNQVFFNAEFRSNDITNNLLKTSINYLFADFNDYAEIIQLENNHFFIKGFFQSLGYCTFYIDNSTGISEIQKFIEKAKEI